MRLLIYVLVPLVYLETAEKSRLIYYKNKGIIFMKRVALHNLGCKVNSYELDVIGQKLREKGFSVVPFDETADIYIVNTCSVTNIADRKSRQMLHQAKKRNPKAVVVAAGCYVQTGTERVLEDDCVDLVVGNNRKRDIAEILEEYLERRGESDEASKGRKKESRADKEPERVEEGDKPDKAPEDRRAGDKPDKASEGGKEEDKTDKTPEGGRDKTLGGKTVIDIGREAAYEEMQLTHTAGHTRAYIKIQDGCNQFCSYCIIPYARGRVRSRRQEDILQEVRGLAGNGFREIVLTGIHVSSYGLDFDQRKNPAKGEAFPHERLLNLLRELDHITGIARIRLSSLEPRIITPEFVAGLKEIRKLCHHFHLSLQSGCDETLLRMNRHYTTGEYLEKVELLREAFDHPAVTTDVIVGFPGESEEEFEKTKRFLENVNFYEMHVFPYSRREGTAAAERRDQIPEAVKKKRSGILLELVKKQSKAFREDYIGRNVEVLFEESKEINGVSCQIGYTGEYIRAAKKTAEDISGKIYAGRLSGFTKDNKLSDNSPSDNLLWFE